MNKTGDPFEGTGIDNARVELCQRTYISEPSPHVIEAVFHAPGTRLVYMGCLPEVIAIHDPKAFSAWKEVMRSCAERFLWKQHPGMAVWLDERPLRLPAL